MTKRKNENPSSAATTRANHDRIDLLLDVEIGAELRELAERLGLSVNATAGFLIACCLGRGPALRRIQSAARAVERVS